MGVPNDLDVAARYARFADTETRGRSPLYEALARGVAADRDVIGFLETLPREKQQPNLLFAAVRHLFGAPAEWNEFRRTLLANRDAVAAVMRSRSTQTNEPARCATLLPLLAQLPPPLALIEVGASAGLCLLPDRYGYDYGRAKLDGAPMLHCAVNDAAPIPESLPQIVWRAGLDLNPLDLSDAGQVAWLETLVWPEQTERLANLRGAIEIAAAFKPRIVKGDLLGESLARLCDEAPKGATLVIFHTAALAYIADPGARLAFAARAMQRGTWISNEMPGVFPDIARRAAARGPAGHFLLSLNGTPVAWTDPHGASLEWIAA
ncbi:MAG: DUF2332 domain-containing protein [Alphaproteobacteria bacterium]